MTIGSLTLVGCAASAEDQAQDSSATEKHAQFAETQADCLKRGFETQDEVISCMEGVTARDAARLDAEVATKLNALMAKQQSGNELDEIIELKGDEFDGLMNKEVDENPR